MQLSCDGLETTSHGDAVVLVALTVWKDDSSIDTIETTVEVLATTNHMTMCSTNETLVTHGGGAETDTMNHDRGIVDPAAQDEVTFLQGGRVMSVISVTKGDSDDPQRLHSIGVSNSHRIDAKEGSIETGTARVALPALDTALCFDESYIAMVFSMIS